MLETSPTRQSVNSTFPSQVGRCVFASLIGRRNKNVYANLFRYTPCFSHVHSACSKCLPPTATQARSLLRHSLIAGPRLQEPDQRRGRAVPARREVGQSWSASDRRCSQGMAQRQESASMRCSWRKTFQTCACTDCKTWLIFFVL